MQLTRSVSDVDEDAAAAAAVAPVASPLALPMASSRRSPLEWNSQR